MSEREALLAALAMLKHIALGGSYPTGVYYDTLNTLMIAANVHWKEIPND